MNVQKALLGVGAACLLSQNLLAQPAVQPQALSPIKPWVVHGDDTECSAERTYGTANDPIILALRPSLERDTYELMLASKRPGPQLAQQLSGTVDFGKGPVKAWLLRYGLADKSFRIDKFRIDAPAIAQSATASNITFRISGDAAVALKLSAVSGVISALDKCNEDLRKFWNMTDATKTKIATAAVGSVRRVFTDGDFPAEAGNLEGKAQFLLLISERGDVSACYVLKPSGVPAFDGTGCQVIRQRARFKPARDAHGNPLRSSVVTPPVIWINGY